MENVIELVNMLDKELLLALATKLTIFMGSSRLIMKPICTFWNKKINPYVDIRPRQKLLKHPLYKSVTFFIDWITSTKAPQEKEY